MLKSVLYFLFTGQQFLVIFSLRNNTSRHNLQWQLIRLQGYGCKCA